MAPGMKTLLLVFMAIMMVSSLSKVISGAIFAIGSDYLNEAIDGLGKGDAKDVAESTTESKAIAIASIVIGCLEFIMTSIGCCGTIRGNPNCLKMYAGLCLFFAFVNLIVMLICAYFISQNDEQTEKHLNNAVKRYDAKDTLNSFYLDFMQVKFGCCGARGKDDYKKSKWYQSTDRKREVPLSCCKLNSEDTRDDYDYFSRKLKESDLATKTCPTAPQGQEFTEKPCLEKQQDFHKGVSTGTLISSLINILVQTVLAYLAWSVAKQL